MEYTFTNENFQAEVLDSEQPVLVDMLWKNWQKSTREALKSESWISMRTVISQGSTA